MSQEAAAEDDEKNGAQEEKPKTFRIPKSMSKEEKEKHDCSHTPFHPSCKHCVRNCGRNNCTTRS